MKHLHRVPISFKARTELARARSEISNAEDARAMWGRIRQRRVFDEVCSALAATCGKRQRCMYCCDSRSCDIDHFEPLASAPARALDYRNFLWICADCNRHKGDRFSGHLIDPTRTDPWRHFVFIEQSGEIAPRWIDEDTEDPQARSTVDIIPTLCHESVTEGRLDAYSRLKVSAVRLLEDSGSLERHAEMAFELRANEFGLARWVTAYEGRRAQPWSTLWSNTAIKSRRLAALASQ